MPKWQKAHTTLPAPNVTPSQIRAVGSIALVNGIPLAVSASRNLARAGTEVDHAICAGAPECFGQVWNDDFVRFGGGERELEVISNAVANGTGAPGLIFEFESVEAFHGELRKKAKGAEGVRVTQRRKEA